MAIFCQLPAEIICKIIESILDHADPSVALPPSHTTTKALLACTLTGHEFNRIARPLLYQRCLYLDNPYRIQSLAATLVEQRWLAKHITQLYVSTPDMATGDAIITILTTISKTLKRLVLDAPLRNYWYGRPSDDPNRSAWRDAFMSCTALEEFTSARDELYLPIISEQEMVDYRDAQPDEIPWRDESVWSYWPNLRRLALYNILLNNYFIGALPPSLTTLVLTRPDIDEERTQNLPLSLDKVIWVNYQWITDYQLGGDSCTLVDSEPLQLVQWKGELPGQVKMGFFDIAWAQELYDLPAINQYTAIETAQQFMRDSAVDGRLWSIGKRMVSKEEHELLMELREQATVPTPSIDDCLTVCIELRS